MQESWFCERCRSLNRAQSNACYRCGAPKAQATLATIQEQRPADVAIPGIDRLDPAQASTLIRQHRYLDVSLLGYMSAGLFTVAAAAGAVTLFVVAGALVAAFVAGYTMSDALGKTVLVAESVLGVALLTGYVSHSLFLGLTARNVPALGGGQPRFGPLRSGFWWIETALWAAWAQIVVWTVPGLIVLLVGGSLVLGFELFGLVGLIAALVLVEYGRREAGISYNVFSYSLGSLRRPARMLDDLVARLASKGSAGHDLVGLWSTSWVISIGISIFMPFLGLGIACLVLLFIVSAAASGVEVALPSTAELNWAVLSFLVLMELLTALTGLLAMFFMTRITLWLVRAQRQRRRWVLAAAGGSGGQPAPAPAAAPVLTPRITPGPPAPAAVATPTAAPPAPPPPPPYLAPSRAAPPAGGIAPLVKPAQPPARVIGYIPDPVRPPAAAPTPGPEAAGGGEVPTDRSSSPPDRPI